MPKSNAPNALYSFDNCLVRLLYCLSGAKIGRKTIALKRKQQIFQKLVFNTNDHKCITNFSGIIFGKFMVNSWKFMFTTKKANFANYHLCKICGRFVSNMIGIL